MLIFQSNEMQRLIGRGKEISATRDSQESGLRKCGPPQTFPTLTQSIKPRPATTNIACALQQHPVSANAQCFPVRLATGSRVQESLALKFL